MKQHILLLLIIPLLASCEKVLFEEDKSTTNPQENFDYLWNQCNEKYSYFELKGIDWNEVKTKYRSKLYTGMSDDSLFNVMRDMLNELQDGHTNLVSNFNASFFDINALGQDNFNFRTISDNYLSKNYYMSGPFAHDFIANGKIGYVRFGEFSGFVTEKNLDFVLNRYKNTQGLILDLRENGGGYASDMFTLLERFVPNEKLVYYSRLKSGEGHNDFSSPEEVRVEPYDGIRYTKPVMVLVDRGTYSAGSFTSLATKAISSVQLVGDTTGGGLGLPNGGQLPNGWTYRFSVSQTLTLDKSPAYENGVPPDIRVDFNWGDLSKDEILDRAIEEILR